MKKDGIIVRRTLNTLFFILMTPFSILIWFGALLLQIQSMSNTVWDEWEEYKDMNK